MNAGTLRDDYSYPLLRHLRGQTAWEAEIAVHDKLANVQVRSDLLGLVSDLPRPFNKLPAERINLRFEQKDINARQNSLKLQYGEIFDATLLRSETGDGNWAIRRGNIVLGGKQDEIGMEGIWIVGRLPHLDLQGWSGWSDVPQREGVLPNIAGINVTLDQVTGFGNRV